jgi:hypothetical protein
MSVRLDHVVFLPRYYWLLQLHNPPRSCRISPPHVLGSDRAPDILFCLISFVATIRHAPSALADAQSKPQSKCHLSQAFLLGAFSSGQDTGMPRSRHALGERASDYARIFARHTHASPLARRTVPV